MLSRYGKWSRSLFLPLLVLIATAAHADPTTVYQVQGQTGAAVWGLGDEPGTEFIAFAFTQVQAVQPINSTAEIDAEKPADPGPRVVFSVTRWAFTDNGWVRRQWYGDVPLADKVLTIAPDLTGGKLDATINGSVEEISQDGTIVQRDVPGRLQVEWVGGGRIANTTSAFTYQTSTWATTLQTVGSGRSAQATASVTVDALGGKIDLWGLGSIAAVTNGLLSVTMK